MTGIYKITSPTNKVYIGQSINIEDRFKYYKRLDCKGQVKLYRSFVKHGIENHVFEIVTLCYEEQLNEFERDFQEAYDVLNGLNCKLTKTNDKSGRMSEYSKLKLSNSRKGIKFSEEHKEKLSKAKINQILSEDTKLKMSINTKTCKKVINTETGEIYHSIRYLAKCININSKTLTHWLNNSRKNKSVYQYL